MPIDIGNGGSVTFGTSSWSAAITNIEWGGLEREAIETTHLGTTTAKSFMPSDLYDPGDLTLTVNYDPNVPPPYTGAAETITVTYPNGATYAGSGFIVSFTPGGMAVDELMEAEVKIKFTGAITQTDGTT